MGHVGIVACILDDACHRIAIAQPFIGELEIGYFPLGQNYTDGIRKFTGNKRRQCRLGGSGCAGARGPAAAELGFFLTFIRWSGFVIHGRLIMYLIAVPPDRIVVDENEQG